MVIEEDLWVESDDRGLPVYHFSRKKSVAPTDSRAETDDPYGWYSDDELSVEYAD